MKNRYTFEQNPPRPTRQTGETHWVIVWVAPSRAVTIIISICSNIAMQHILRRAIYCSILHVLCEPELDHWNVNVDKLLFLCENPRQLTFIRIAEHILVLPVTGLIITTSVLQYSNILWTSCMQYAICQFAVL